MGRHSYFVIIQSNAGVVTSGERVIDAGGDAAAVESRDVSNDDAAAINDTYIDTLNLWVASTVVHSS